MISFVFISWTPFGIAVSGNICLVKTIIPQKTCIVNDLLGDRGLLLEYRHSTDGEIWILLPVELNFSFGGKDFLRDAQIVFNLSLGCFVACLFCVLVKLMRKWCLENEVVRTKYVFKFNFLDMKGID